MYVKFFMKVNMKYLFFLSFILFLAHGKADDDCNHRSFGYESTVCVCNSTNCDFIQEIEAPTDRKFHWYASDMAGKRMRFSIGEIKKNETQDNYLQLLVDRTKHYQKMIGFGGAFTDSSGINIDALSPETQQQLFQTYFGKNGSRYNLGRTPIAGSDFSTRGYSYDDTEGDIELKNFALQEEDMKLKIPKMLKALELNPDLKFMAAAWTAPPWMKTTKTFEGFGFLKPEYFQTYTNYLMNFLDEYIKHGIEFKYLSTGNEPNLIPETPVNLSTMSWTTNTAMKWITDNLGPTLDHSQHNKTEIMGLDDQRAFLPYHMQIMFTDKVVKEYVKSIGIHYYMDSRSSPELLDKTHELFPDKPLLMSEACVGFLPDDLPKVKLGSWERAEFYILKMIENINHWVAGWIDWNLVLDQNGGPNFINNNVDAPIIVNPESDEFFKQPLYYAIAHFSRFVPRESIRLNVTYVEKVPAAVFLTPELTIVAVLCNLNDEPVTVSINDLEKKIIVDLSARSFNTIIF